jgi:hypothetical protein
VAKASRLTNQTIESTKVMVGERWLSDDDGGRGGGRLAVRIRPDGRRLFYFRYSIDGKRTAIPLGAYTRVPNPGSLTLEEARELVRRYSAMYRDPQTRDVQAHLGTRTANAERQSAPSLDVGEAPQVASGQFTLMDVCNNYVQHLKRQGRQCAGDTASYFRVHVAPTQWANIPANAFTSRQAADLLRRVIDAGHKTTAVHVRRALHAAYQLAKKAATDASVTGAVVDMGVENNPIAGTASLSQFIRPRARPALTNLELGHLWLALSEGPLALEVAIRFIRLSILLGGQRCIQLLRCKLTSFDLDKSELTLLDPKGRRQTPREHVLPLNPLAKAEAMALRQMSRDLGNSYLIAGKNKDAPLTSGPISRALQPISAQLVRDGKLEQPFQYADIRRTVETRLAALDVSESTRAQIQSHGISGVQVKHYDKWTYMPQKREALAKWERFLCDCAEEARRQPS